MNIDNLELTMGEIYEIVFGRRKDYYSSHHITLASDMIFRDEVLRLPISGHDFFGEYVWNCKTLIDNGIFDRVTVEKYVSEKLKFMQAAFDNFECFKKIEEEK